MANGGILNVGTFLSRMMFSYQDSRNTRQRIAGAVSLYIKAQLIPVTIVTPDECVSRILPKRTIERCP